MFYIIIIFLSLSLLFTHTSTGICPGTTLVAIKYTSTNETSGRQGTGSKTTNGNMNAWLSTPANAYNGGYGRKRGGRSDANRAKKSSAILYDSSVLT